MAKDKRSGKRGARQFGQTSLARIAEVRTTLGDLIAAAFDTVGDTMNVAELLGSRELRRAAHGRIVLQ